MKQISYKSLKTLFVLSVFLLLNNCSNEEDWAKGKGLEMSITREDDRLQINLRGTAENYNNGPGTYIVFIPEQSLKNAIQLTGVKSSSVIIYGSGTYDTPSQDESALKMLTLSIT